MSDCCCNNPQGGDTSCVRMIPTSTPKTILVGDSNTCARSLPVPTATPSIIIYSDGRVSWADGSETTPICFPNLQTITDLSDMAYMLGVNTDGCLVKIAITVEQITTCEGPILTVPVTAVT